MHHPVETCPKIHFCQRPGSTVAYVTRLACSAPLQSCLHSLHCLKYETGTLDGQSPHNTPSILSANTNTHLYLRDRIKTQRAACSLPRCERGAAWNTFTPTQRSQTDSVSSVWIVISAGIKGMVCLIVSWAEANTALARCLQYWVRL